MKTKNLIVWLIASVLLMACQEEKKYTTKTDTSGGYAYEYVTGDPLSVRLYTLENGLKVYLSKYEAEPRIYTSIAVKAGGKFDPSEATGLAHYLEHIMFKGTADFGTLDWEQEEPMLDSIENMFEHYRTLTDAGERLAYYKNIDAVSGEASAFAIANEYDKMVAEIGARGTNAYTTNDRTVYINDIPANQIENWLTLEANRFQRIVPRLFHTELEAVYEEKNRSLDNDNWKVYETLNRLAFQKHPYGTQTVIGTIDHLKNPSIAEIKKYFRKYYRPNNVAICLSGDLDYDKTIALVDKAFGDWEPNDALKEWVSIKEDPIEEPHEEDVYGPEAESVMMAFRFDDDPEDMALLRLTDMILSNSEAGLIDLNLKQQQKVLDAFTYVNAYNDYSLHVFYGIPREGQSLETLKGLLLDQLSLVKAGDFEDWLIEATINDLKKYELVASQKNRSRSNAQVMAFTTNTEWRDYITRTENLSKYTKEDVIKFVEEHYQENYVTVFKRYGKDPNTQRVEKPSITKVDLNKEEKSPFHEEILANKPEKIKARFVDYEKDIKRLEMEGGVEVLYAPNKENDLFELYYVINTGTNQDPRMKDAVEYLQYLGTDNKRAEDIKKGFYKLGCSFEVGPGSERTYVSLTGLDENMDEAVVLLEELLANPKPNEEGLSNMIDGIFKTREDNKKNKRTILFKGLLSYGLFGANNSFTNVLTNQELAALKSDALTSLIQDLTQYEHQVLYYGPRGKKGLLSSLNSHHKLANPLKPVPAPVTYTIEDMTDPSVYWTHYDMVQAEILFLSKGDVYSPERVPVERMFNEYFGGNMSSPVFQELREAQGLAYSAYARYRQARKAGDHNFFFAYIGTQADKQIEAMEAMQGLIQNFPKSEGGFEVARNSLMNQLESQRIIRSSLLFNYLDAQRLGNDHDIRKDVYEQLQNMTLEDLENFQNKNIAGRPANVVLVGDRKKLNLRALSAYGTVKELTLDELFGYGKPVKINKEGLPMD